MQLKPARIGGKVTAVMDGVTVGVLVPQRVKGCQGRSETQAS
jgi:hypothetical protein